MARLAILVVLISLMIAGIFDYPAKSAPSFEFGPDGFKFWFDKDAKPPKRRFKCREHWHYTWSYDYRHTHCIPRNKSWRSHERRGH